jgi:parallel beta-helix repeat protein
VRRGRRLLFVLVLLGAVTAPSRHADAAPLPVVLLGCDTIWGNDPGEGSFRLGNNMNCTTPFLQIVRDGITVDLGGHRITGDGASNGLRIFDRKNVTVRNGVLDNFDFTIIAGRNSGLRLQNLVLKSGNLSNPGLEIQGGDLGGGRGPSGNISITGNTIVDDTSINLSNGAQGVTVSGNTLIRSRISVTGVDGNTVSGNRIYGGAGPGVLIADGSEGTKVIGNQVIGTDGIGISVTGNDADDNLVQRNIVRGNLAAPGIGVTDADRTRIAANTVTGNDAGVSLFGTTEDTSISGNNVSANHAAGIHVGSGTGTKITSNNVSENGGTGIEAFGNSTSINDNRLNFNGYDQGLNNNSIPGAISGINITGGGNTAAGNDVSGPTQCSPDICNDGSPAPPPLTTCGQNITTQHTLRNPLVCETSAFGLLISGSGFTVNLGPHIVTGGNGIAADESAVKVNNNAAAIQIVGGVIANAKNGVFTPSASPAKQITISRSTIVGNDSSGVILQGVDATPDDATVTAGRNQILSSTLVGNGAAGIFAFQAPRNTIRGNVVADTPGGAVDISQSAGNLVEANRFIGNSSGVDLSNDGAPTGLPTKETIRSNAIVGSSAAGIKAFNIIENTIAANAIRGSGDSGQPGILLDGGASPGGSLDNLLSANTVTGSGGNGITLAADSSENRIQGNTVSGNDAKGIDVGAGADDDTMSGNRVHENGSDGIVVAEPSAPTEVPDVVSNNAANRNGFLATATGANTGDDVGFGIDIADDTTGGGNTATGNDNPFQCSPNAFC